MTLAVALPWILFLPQGLQPGDPGLQVRASESPGFIPGCYLASVRVVDGRITVEAVDSEGEEGEQSRVLEESEMATLQRVIASSRFFTLSPQLGCLPTEATERTMSVEAADKQHSVTLFERGDHPNCLSSADETKRAFAVWETIEALSAFAVEPECQW